MITTSAARGCSKARLRHPLPPTRGFRPRARRRARGAFGSDELCGGDGDGTISAADGSADYVSCGSGTNDTASVDGTATPTAATPTAASPAATATTAMPTTTATDIPRDWMPS